jgi:hypothetical protein
MNCPAPRTPLCHPVEGHVCDDVCDWPLLTDKSYDRLALLLRSGASATATAGKGGASRAQ